MADRKDGGPAFPISLPGPGYGDNGASGMTLRDWLAGQALAGIAADWPTSPNNLEKAAKLAYSLADLMLAERAKS